MVRRGHIKNWAAILHGYFQNRCVFLNKSFPFVTQILLTFVPGVQVSNLTPLVQMMTGIYISYKPLSETMMVYRTDLLTRICVNQFQWVKWECHENPLICINRDLFTEIGKTKLITIPRKSGHRLANSIFKFLSKNGNEWITTQNILNSILLCILYIVSTLVYGLAYNGP